MKISILPQALLHPAYVETFDYESQDNDFDIQVFSHILTTCDWVPGVFKNNHRANEDFLETHIIGLDIDKDFPLSTACKFFADYKHVMGTTKSHGIKKESDPVERDRFRIILFLSSPINNIEIYRHTVRKVIESTGYEIDRASEKASQFFYRCKEVVQSSSEGKLIDPIKNIPKIKRQPKIWKGPKAKLHNLTPSTRRFIICGAKENFNDTLFKVSCECIKKGWTYEDMIEVVARVGYKGCADSVDKSTIMSAVKTVRKQGRR